MKASLCAFLIAAAALIAPVRVQAEDADAAIENSVKTSYVFRHFLKHDDVRVKSFNGVVTLTGTVSDGFHKSLAEETVKAQLEVKFVDDKLTVKDGGPSKMSAEWLTAKVKSLMTFHRGVSAHETKIETADGVVTLRGRAESQAQKELTEAYARDVEGVKKVKNEMTIAAASKARKIEENIDDASITAEVKIALLFHRSTSALKTTVKTLRGTVTLGGAAGSDSEKDLATGIVKDVRGVKDVDNQMSVIVISSHGSR